MCVLRVCGKKFNPAKYLTSSTLKPYSIFQRGEIASPRKGTLHQVSGFKVDVSRPAADDLAGQVDDAVRFLKKHRRTLARLRSLPEVEDIRLDFPVDLRIDRKHIFAQYDYFPPELVSLAGALGCGLEMSIYPRDLLSLAKKGSRRRTARRRVPR
jgi:hypothetical protein